jgi:hypothetical protein
MLRWQKTDELHTSGLNSSTLSVVISSQGAKTGMGAIDGAFIDRRGTKMGRKTALTLIAFVILLGGLAIAYGRAEASHCKIGGYSVREVSGGNERYKRVHTFSCPSGIYVFVKGTFTDRTCASPSAVNTTVTCTTYTKWYPMGCRSVSGKTEGFIWTGSTWVKHQGIGFLYADFSC